MKAKVEIATRTGGAAKLVDIPLRLLATDGEAVLRMLEADGVEINSAPGSRELVIQYLRQSIAQPKREGVGTLAPHTFRRFSG